MSDAASQRSWHAPKHLTTHIILSLGVVVMVAPFLWELLTSVKTFAETIKVPPTFLPSSWKWGNFSEVFRTLPFAHMMLNSVIMTVAQAAGQVCFCSMAGYAFARLRFRGSGVIFALFLSVLMIPQQLYILPRYEFLHSLGLVNTLPGLFLPGIFGAFGTFLMRQFFLQLPTDLEEAATLDGAGPYQRFWWVMLPLARPGMAALGILVVVWSWNELLWPLIINTEPSKMTLSPGLASLQGEYLTQYPILMAGSVVASVPLIIAFLLFQRYFIESIAFTGIKG